MFRFQLVAGSIGLMVSLLSGCHCIEQTYVPMACNDKWDPVLGSCQQCGVCGGEWEGHTPVSYAKHHFTCASGCGEIYWGDWVNHPPHRCDPCGRHGEWIGPQFTGPMSCWDRMVAGWCSFWGYRTNACVGCTSSCGKGKAAACTKSGCSSCGVAAGGKGVPHLDPEILLDPPAEMPQSEPADPTPPQPELIPNSDAVEQTTSIRPRLPNPIRSLRLRSVRLSR